MSGTLERQVVVLSGDVDLYNEAQITERLMRAVNDAAATVVVVDLGAVTLLGSAGLHMLVAARNELARTGRLLLLANVTPQVHRVLEATRLDELFETTGNACR
jgi:anti-anti-sigma factor